MNDQFERRVVEPDNLDILVTYVEEACYRLNLLSPDSAQSLAQVMMTRWRHGDAGRRFRLDHDGKQFLTKQGLTDPVGSIDAVAQRARRRWSKDAELSYVSQYLKPNATPIFVAVAIDAGQSCCAAVAPLTGCVYTTGQKLPILSELRCDADVCHCWYRPLTRSELARRLAERAV